MLVHGLIGNLALSCIISLLPRPPPSVIKYHTCSPCFRVVLSKYLFFLHIFSFFLIF